MKKIFKVLLGVLIVVLGVSGIISLVNAKPVGLQTTQATYSIDIIQQDCFVKVLGEENEQVDFLVNGNRYTITATTADGYSISNVTLNNEQIILPYLFTAKENIIINAIASIRAPIEIEEGINLTYSLQNCNIEFYRSDNDLNEGWVESRVDIIKYTFSGLYFVVIPFEGYVIEDVQVNDEPVSCPCYINLNEAIKINAVAVLPEYATQKENSVYIGVDFHSVSGLVVVDELSSVFELTKINPSHTINFELLPSEYKFNYQPYGNHFCYTWCYVSETTITFSLSPYAFINSDVREDYHFELI